MNTIINTPKLSISHPNGKGTGSAILFELKPAHGLEPGSIYCRIANQKPISSDKATTTPQFDWENSIIARLGFKEICQILQVFRGETESINNHNGLVINSKNAIFTVKLTHNIEPVCGYTMSFACKYADGNLNESSIFFSYAEGLGISEAFGGALTFVAFGTGFEATSIAIARDEAMAKTTPENN